ncbi:MAG: OmpA family protein [Actinomycetota bacterium]|nr:OmpA family protein [Acidimicrobiia bacterium]MDQ3293130.1 OmpA family protein [Actinomycetota bacterium]
MLEHTKRAAAALLTLLVVACGGDDAASPPTTAAVAETSTTSTTEAEETTTTTEAEEETTTTTVPALPAGQTAGVDDFDDNGEGDPTCGEQDFGAGLVLRVYCDREAYASSPPEGVTLVEGSLYRFPTDNEAFDMTDISADAIVARDSADERVFVFVFNSDALFATGSSDILAPATFDNLIARINQLTPGARIQVRGHTDGTGDPASNQALSERRSASVQAYLTEHGVQAAEVAAVGLGQTQPLAVEDGDAGRSFNRRVEVVIRPAA